MKSTLTLPYLTCIDHAYLDEKGSLQGRSYHASFTVTGEVDETDEKVVIDFSKVKKLIKAIVDDHDTGFDHKLWVDSTYVSRDSEVLVHSDYVSLDIPENAVCVFPLNTHLASSTAEEVIANHVQHVLKHRHGYEVDIKCALSTDPLFMHMGGVYGMFNYAHGLKDSTAYGCQNLAHGHLSYLQLIPKAATDIRVRTNPSHYSSGPAALSVVCEQICRDLSNTIFVYGDNADTTLGCTVRVSYCAKNRGEMQGVFSTCDTQKVVVLETETTVEYLAEYINAKYGEVLKEVGVDRFVVSEGLSKGVLFELT